LESRLPRKDWKSVSNGVVDRETLKGFRGDEYTGDALDVTSRSILPTVYIMLPQLEPNLIFVVAIQAVKNYLFPVDGGGFQSKHSGLHKRNCLL
jgi:hypothetical protein